MALTIMAVLSRFADILLAPVRMPELLWILIPVYISWIFIDIYQEAGGTKFGNAIANGFVAMWVGLDWGRALTSKISSGLNTQLVIQGVLSIFLVVLGLTIVIEGVRGKKFVRYIARIREITYLIICLTPIFYGLVPVDLTTIVAILVFFPIWFIVFEIVTRVVPKPGEGEFGEDTGAGKLEMGKGMDLGKMDMGKDFDTSMPPDQGFPPNQGFPPQGGMPPGF